MNTSTTTTYSVCSPITPEHRRGMRWFASLAQAINQSASLKHSVQFYSLFAQTGDKQYLERCEDFLRYTLSVR